MTFVDQQISPDRAIVQIDGLPELRWTASGHAFSAADAAFALLAALPVAMSRGGGLHIRGTVDGLLLRNAGLLSHFWSQWKPQRYRPVEVTADHVIDGRAAGGGRAGGAGHVICLSGGIDSTFALVSAASDERPHMRLRMPLGVFVQGFDYSAADGEGFSRVLGSVRSLAAAYDAEVAAVETNWKAVVCLGGHAEWEAVHTIGLGAILHLFSGELAGGVIGSDYTFRDDHLVAPWGSNAVVNRLLGSGSFDIMPLGEDHSRVEKLRRIHERGHLAGVNVCWAGPRTGRNCGRCRKCLQTMLMCEALGIDQTPAFGRRLSPAEVRTMPMGSGIFVRQALDMPGSRLSPAFRRAVQVAAVVSRGRDFLLPHARKARAWLRKARSSGR